MTSPEAAPSFRAWTHSTPPFPSTLSLIQQSPPKPADLKPHEILVEVVTAALNPVDVQVKNLPIFRLAALKYPKGIGCDFAGRILGKGTEVKDLQIGAEVMGMTFNPLGGVNYGTLSEIAVIDMSRSCVVAKPPALPWVQAAAIPLVYLTAKTLLSPPYLILPPSANPDPTDASSHRIQPTIVVLGGSSSVGQYVVQLAKKQLHFKVIATCSKRNVDFVQELGADEVIDYTVEDVVQRVKELRPAEGYVQIVDCVGGTDFLPHIPSLVSPRTKAYPAGGSYQTIVGDKTSRLAMGGSILYLTHPTMLVRMLKGWAGIGYRYSCIMLNATRRDWLAQVGRLVHDEGLRVEIDSEWEFEEVEKAYEKLNTGKVRGKVVVHVKHE
ncbi:hypothetical protein NBRC10512_004977 [Rhodotorula toruloides]|uniref:RHTO0S01e14114g1_1 n=2 Tax=Rhodotorula toruloides TaxID=5286 RepID=A0A061AG34_RHOTO|nr:zinc alcohol dehydrogenase [Rhodotorula toruloides NP11]EMS24456.1 zinc alcohol dehydrogenase [Rhodotorula toruloides NP11]KAJ8297007.1 Protein YIM1 [Rhodotorula toruloides]CDR36093.1 RHTO0S01e14114g1_1 [Rhodotorula toruloides]